jgi:uncharacterized protein
MVYSSLAVRLYETSTLTFKEFYMVDPKLLEILCCPETKQDVQLIEPAVIKKINKTIKKGTVKNRGGETVSETIDAGLLRDDRKFLYPIRQDIPIMLIDEGIPFEQFDS